MSQAFNAFDSGYNIGVALNHDQHSLRETGVLKNSRPHFLLGGVHARRPPSKQVAPSICTAVRIPCYMFHERSGFIRLPMATQRVLMRDGCCSVETNDDNADRALLYGSETLLPPEPHVAHANS